MFLDRCLKQSIFFASARKITARTFIARSTAAREYESILPESPTLTAR